MVKILYIYSEAVVMTESNPLNYLFRIDDGTKGITKEQFLTRYSEMKAAGVNSESSIFSSGVEGSIEQLFDTINKSGDDNFIDASEIAALASNSTDDGENVLSESDLVKLYQDMADNIMKNYLSTSPEVMYNTSMSKFGDHPEENTYIQDLSGQIQTLQDLVTSRQITSNSIIKNLEDQIADVIKRNLDETNDANKKFKDKYDKKQQELNKYIRKSNENEQKLREAAAQKQDAELEIRVILEEIQSLDQEKDKDKIADLRKELSTVQKRFNNAKEDVDSYTEKKEDLANKISKTQSELSKMSNSDILQRLNDEKNSKIQELKQKIADEKEKAKNDIIGYNDKINTLKQAQAYAVQHTQEVAAKSAESLNFESQSGRKTSFKELSAKGLKYSSEKGQKLAQDIRSHSVGFIGKCSRYVSNALERTGLGHERRASAHMMDSALRGNGNFREITVSSLDELKSLPAGCIVVYEAGAKGYNKVHGHIEVTLGDGRACSDGVTRNMRFAKGEQMHVFVPVENA